jgi:8-oxo-dGTP pyrophosphatase MutT (NUDIX family)
LHEEATTDLPTQTGAVPCRTGTDGQVEVLLVTGKGSRRWIIPKGWPMPGMTLAEAAAQEAFEEAGVRGSVEPQPLGNFRHQKNIGPADIEVRIVVHAMRVEQELADYPEARSRERRWFSVAEAVEAVGSAKLGRLIGQFAERLRT